MTTSIFINRVNDCLAETTIGDLGLELRTSRTVANYTMHPLSNANTGLTIIKLIDFFQSKNYTMNETAMAIGCILHASFIRYQVNQKVSLPDLQEAVAVVLLEKIALEWGEDHDQQAMLKKALEMKSVPEFTDTIGKLGQVTVQSDLTSFPTGQAASIENTRLGLAQVKMWMANFYGLLNKFNTALNTTSQKSLKVGVNLFTQMATAAPETAYSRAINASFNQNPAPQKEDFFKKNPDASEQEWEEYSGVTLKLRAAQTTSWKIVTVTGKVWATSLAKEVTIENGLNRLAVEPYEEPVSVIGIINSELHFILLQTGNGYEMWGGHNRNRFIQMALVEKMIKLPSGAIVEMADVDRNDLGNTPLSIMIWPEDKKDEMLHYLTVANQQRHDFGRQMLSVNGVVADITGMFPNMNAVERTWGYEDGAKRTTWKALVLEDQREAVEDLLTVSVGVFDKSKHRMIAPWFFAGFFDRKAQDQTDTAKAHNGLSFYGSLLYVLCCLAMNNEADMPFNLTDVKEQRTVDSATWTYEVTNKFRKLLNLATTLVCCLSEIMHYAPFATNSKMKISPQYTTKHYLSMLYALVLYSEEKGTTSLTEIRMFVESYCVKFNTTEFKKALRTKENGKKRKMTGQLTAMCKEMETIVASLHAPNSTKWVSCETIMHIAAITKGVVQDNLRKNKTGLLRTPYIQHMRNKEKEAKEDKAKKRGKTSSSARDATKSDATQNGASSAADAITSVGTQDATFSAADDKTVDNTQNGASSALRVDDDDNKTEDEEDEEGDDDDQEGEDDDQEGEDDDDSDAGSRADGLKSDHLFSASDSE